MKGSKYLSELVDCSTFQKGKLNLIEAPTGCGKTAFALRRIPALIKNAHFKVIIVKWTDYMLIYSLSIYLYQSNKLSVCAVYDQAITIWLTLLVCVINFYGK